MYALVLGLLLTCDNTTKKPVTEDDILYYIKLHLQEISGKGKSLETESHVVFA